MIDNKNFYEKSIKEFGISAQGVHWNSKYTQYKRFEIITKFIKKELKDSSLIDLGSGFGEYYNFLAKKKIFPKKYIGIDCEDIMVQISQKRFKDQQFLSKNILYEDIPEADFIISSGALNILSFDQCKIFIQKGYKLSRKGFIFNYLKNDTFIKINKEKIIEIVNNLTDNFRIKENYLDNDFTIFMKK